MKWKIFLFGSVVSLVLIFNNCNKQFDFPVLRDPYLGQEPPGRTVELFAPGIISQAGFELHSSLAITTDGKEIYFAYLVRDEERPRNVIMRVKYLQGKWSSPEVAPFSGEYNDTNPTISGDGKRIYFSSNRPIIKNGKIKKRTRYLVFGKRRWRLEQAYSLKRFNQLGYE